MNRLTAVTCAALAAAASLFAAGSASATVYNDATNDNHDGNAHMDIESVTVTNDATNLYFTVDLRGPVASPNDWGRYVAGIDVGAGGAESGNPWGRAINMPGMDFWIGSWVNTTPAGSQLWDWNGTGWDEIASAGLVAGSDTLSYTIPLATLGVGDGSIVKFDFYTTGGGGSDSANDASSNPNQASPDWSTAYTSNAVSSYQVVVPEPASIGLAAIAALALSRRHRGRRSM